VGGFGVVLIDGGRYTRYRMGHLCCWVSIWLSEMDVILWVIRYGGRMIMVGGCSCGLW
jgi:hypothetical protein